MESVRGTKNRVAIAAVAAALISALVVTIVAARPAEGAEPVATASASVTKQLKQLKQRIAQLEGRGNTTPTGPAGGDLAGTYPNPRIGANTIGSDEVIDNSLAAVDIAPDAIGADEIAPLAVGSSEIGTDTVGGSELKTTVARVSGAGAGSDDTFVTNAVGCQPDEVLVGGGFAWQNDTAVDMVTSAPSNTDPTHIWIVRGRSATFNRLFAWANCLQA